MPMNRRHLVDSLTRCLARNIVKRPGARAAQPAGVPVAMAIVLAAILWRDARRAEAVIREHELAVADKAVHAARVQRQAARIAQGDKHALEGA